MRGLVRDRASGQGIANVGISDGYVVARTDNSGRFEFSGSGKFVFVSNPVGFVVSEWYRVAGASDIVFECAPEMERKELSFIQLTDLHLSLTDVRTASVHPRERDAANGFANDISLMAGGISSAMARGPFLSAIERNNAASFVVVTGDVTNQALAGEFRAYCDLIGSVSVQTYTVPGNHDCFLGEDGALDWQSYERYLGPRWYSFNRSGMHFVCMDWYSYVLDLQRERQLSWLLADLAAHADLPYIVFSHDQMPREVFQQTRPPVATFSGHWHASRVVTLGETLSYSTGSSLFGGLDYSPPHYRVATWEGRRLAVQAIAHGPSSLAGTTFRAGRHGSRRQCDGALWSHQLLGASHLAEPIAADGAIILTAASEDEPVGYVDALSRETGELLWRVATESAIKVAPLVIDQSVVATTVSGTTVCLRLDDGEELWRAVLSDEVPRWCFLRPVSDGNVVVTGDVQSLVCIRLDTGEVLWEQDDLGYSLNHVAYAHPAIIGHRLLVGFWPQSPDLQCLDMRTGSPIWVTGGAPPPTDEFSYFRDVDWIETVRQAPVAGVTPDPDRERAYVLRSMGALSCISVYDGSEVWRADVPGMFNPGQPIVDGDGVFVASQGRGLMRLRRSDGRMTWRIQLDDPGPLAFVPYWTDGRALLTTPTPANGLLYLPLTDGRIYILAADTGRRVGCFDTAFPITSRVAVDEGKVMAVTADGVVVAFPAVMPTGQSSQIG